MEAELLAMWVQKDKESLSAWVWGGGLGRLLGGAMIWTELLSGSRMRIVWETEGEIPGVGKAQGMFKGQWGH